MRILVIGAGAVGSAIGGYLSESNEVLLVGRGEHIARISKHGLTIEGILGNTSHRPEACTARELKDHSFLRRPLDWIILSVKSTDTATAIRELMEAGLLSRVAGLVHIQNGMGNLETIQETLNRSAGKVPLVLSGMTITGYEIYEPGKVRITVYGGPGKIGWLAHSVLGDSGDSGAAQPPESLAATTMDRPAMARQLTALLASTPLVFEYTEQMISFLWAKLLYNSCLNPLGALLRVPYGELRNESTLSIMKEVLKEAFALAHFAKVPLFWDDADQYFQHLLQTLIPATARHEPSMLADLNRGRKTEIQALNGYIVRNCEAAGLAAPVNRTLTELIEASSRLCEQR
ncbi:MAG: ketopantoate reductase family protein [Leptospiraceae bacterium]|nr:ketopantoate reductase family protein [Leptospiraceae bacterium]